MNREIINAYAREWYRKRKEKQPNYCKQIYQENKEQILAYQKKYYQEHKEEFYKRHKLYYQANSKEINERIRLSLTPEKLEIARIRKRESSNRLKLEVLTHYGNGKFACINCNESRFPCLSLDHINGDGAKQRREGQKEGRKLYRWLRDNNYPEGYKTLCMNCRWAKKYKNKEYSNGRNQYSH